MISTIKEGSIQKRRMDMTSYMELQVDYTIIIALLMFSAAVSCVLCVYIITKSRSGRVMVFFIIGQIFTIMWTVLYIFELLAPTVGARWVIVCIEYIVLCYVGVVFLQFAYAYTKHELLPRRWTVLTLVMSSIGYLSVLTNNYHHWFYKSFSIDGEVFGPMAYYIIVSTMVDLLGGAIIFATNKHRRKGSQQKQSMYFSIAIVVPVGVHFLQVIGVLDFGFAIALVFIPFSVLLFIVSILKYQFLDVLPIAINDTIDGMLDGMLVVDGNGKVIDSNETFFKKMFGMMHTETLQTYEAFVKDISKYLVEEEDYKEMSRAIEVDDEDVRRGTMTIQAVDKKQHIIYYTAKPIMDHSHYKMATLITFFDMTKIHYLYKELEIKNAEMLRANMRLENLAKQEQQLAVELERNHMMADIHDTLGHSMMELLALLEVCDYTIDIKKDDETVIKTVENALNKARNSLAEVRQAVSNYRQMGGF